MKSIIVIEKLNVRSLPNAKFTDMGTPQTQSQFTGDL
jgi:hypothetical protein